MDEPKPADELANLRGDRAGLLRVLLALGIPGDQARWQAMHPGLHHMVAVAP
jgi:hypothetical protein